ncbi:uncharacterized protein C4orf54 homolog [Chanos chanos]|uniref:Uncharacterized protein C4orf54 homolog n=1 Tax=Chanos chanos TaxID=29144 RepID=A0A6J2VSX7_CHACN|nr:uncharacterized protein C4orf54 homolog [Chanos chanos]
MAASEKALIYQENNNPIKNRLSDKDIHMIGTQDETNYVDLNNLLDLKFDDTKTVKVTFTGEASQLAIFKCGGTNVSTSTDKVHGENEQTHTPTHSPTIGGKSINHEFSGDVRTDEHVAGDCSGSFETATSSEIPQINENFTDCPESPIENQVAETDAKIDNNAEMISNDDDCEILQYTDVYLSRKTDSEDDVSVVLSDHCLFDTIEDESHYITTHEIQLSELDHDVDFDGVGSSWDIEDDHQVFSFVDYASFDSDETIGGKEDSASARVKSNQAQSNTSGAAVSSKIESDLCDTDKCASSDESLSKNQNGIGNSAGQIHLSIKTTSRAINEPSNVQEKENILYHAKHTGDMSRYVFRGADTKADKICDSTKCFIALPGRLHFGHKLKGKDVNEYSSGASSAVSELDDADKEVRNLTARAFKSLAYPYFDAINFSTSSESSASEHGLGINRWSTFVDLKYGNIKGRDQNLVAHKSSTSNFRLAKNRDSKGITGLTLTSMRAPPVEIFALNGNLAAHKNASSSTKKIEMMGKFGQGQSGVIRLTETLNFRCNVKAGLSGNERRVKSAQNTTGSRSTDEVTDTLPGGQESEASKRSCNAGEAMEDTHKKAIFASSLLKNVISKKMQFEQERKMERGEICEPHHAPSPCFQTHEHETHREKVATKESGGLQRQSSKFSEADSDFTIVCVDELGDIVDSNSGDAKDDCHRDDTGFDTKKGAFEASKSTLLRSQNSAFRSWRDGELEFQKEHKNDKTPEGKLPPSDTNLGETDLHSDQERSKLTKMSHLFVPSIQLLSDGGDAKKSLQNMNYSTHASVDHGDGGGMQLRSGNTLYVSDTTKNAVTTNSPEIKISLRSVKDNKNDPLNIAKLLTPNIGCSAANLIKAADDSKYQALAAAFKGDSSDKVPHFMVRDIRENKGKLQTPIHQVRDVRKLVKSSYHFVSLDNNEGKSNVSADGEYKVFKQGPYRNPTSLSPIVIKCQSVNTNSNVKQSANLIELSKRRLNEDILDVARSSPQVPTEGAKNGTAPVNRSPGRAPVINTKQPKSEPSESPTGLRIETRTATRRQEKPNETVEKKPETKMANQAALEKLQAAVKTMEQLYVFDKNEWKRKTEPQPLTDSHVLSLIAREEHGGSEEEQGDTSSSVATANAEKLVRRDSYTKTDKTPPAVVQSTASEVYPNREEKEPSKTSSTSVSREERNGLKAFVHQGGITGNKSVCALSQSQKASVCTTANSSIKASQMYASSPSKSFVPKSPKLPISLKISHPKRVVEERQRPNGSEADRFAPAQDPENYLTIPVKSHAGNAMQAATSGREKTSVYTMQTTGGVGPSDRLGHGDSRRHGESRQSPKRSSIVMETRSPDTPTATIYHHPLPMTVSAAQPQVICFSPTMQPPPPPPVDHFQPTQRKMLLDPTTGNYYLVDTPVQPATRRLFDPETGQYVDIPMPQQPMTPMPMPISPLALSPGAYSHTYMFYPGYMPTPTVIPARTIQSQLSMQSEADERDKTHIGQQGDGAYMETPYYVASGKSPQAAPMAQHVTTGRSTDGKPVISITSQQGPRIIAPPSFDGTTMSFVVEHR